MQSNSVKSGEYFVQSSQFSGGGSFDLLENPKSAKFLFYSPFGSVVAEIEKKIDSLFLFFDEQELRLSLNDSLSLPFIPANRFLGSELFDLLSGISPVLSDADSTAKNDVPLTATWTVHKNGSRVKSIVFSDSMTTIVLEKPERNRFRSVELRADRRNYFRIVYDIE